MTAQRPRLSHLALTSKVQQGKKGNKFVCQNLLTWILVAVAAAWGLGHQLWGLCLRWKQGPDPSTSAFRRLENRACSLAVSNRLHIRVGYLNKNQPSPTETPPTNFPLGWRGDDGFSRPPSGPFPNPKWGGGTGHGCPWQPPVPRVDPRALSPAGSTRASQALVTSPCHLPLSHLHVLWSRTTVSVPRHEAFSVLYVGTRQTGCGLVF